MGDMNNVVFKYVQIVSRKCVFGEFVPGMLKSQTVRGENEKS